MKLCKAELSVLFCSNMVHWQREGITTAQAEKEGRDRILLLGILVCCRSVAEEELFTRSWL